jgi:hypothetical protein
MSDMDEKRAAYSLKAPGASGASALHLPGRARFPGLNEHLVAPEVSRDEVIKGRRVTAHPALEAHGDEHSELDFVVRGLVAPGYQVSTDLLTRVGKQSDFASDTSIRRQGKDPATGSRYLEEIVFEVVSTQSEVDVTEKAEEMHKRGMRRIFAIFVKGPRRVCEWSPRDRRWTLLDTGARIEDSCLITPLAVSALLDAALADSAVVKAMKAKGNPEILELEADAEARGEAKGRVEGEAKGRVEGEAKSRAEGEAKGKVEAVLKVLEARGVAVSQAQREEIARCSDLARLSRWVVRALSAASAEEVTAEP